MGKLPTIVRDTEEHYSINESRRMVGKTVQRVDFGTLKLLVHDIRVKCC